MLDEGPRTPADSRFGLLTARVVEMRVEAVDVVSLRLRGVGEPLPHWEAGAHVDLHLPSGAVRQYSLCGLPGADWRIAVLRQSGGRGGSDEVHRLRPGQELRVSRPRNLFPLLPAPRYLFIAGGIGITPILAMLRAAEAGGADWRLVYLGRSAERMAFAAELAARDPTRVTLRQTDHEGVPPAAAFPDLAGGAPVYACGPAGLLAALEAAFAAAGRHADLHLERFDATASPKPGDGTIRLHLARSGRFVDVPPGVSLLAALRAAGVDVASSCEQGFCGTCECRVLEGTPDHRDTLLSDEERARGHLILPCVSRAVGDALTLDL